MANDTPAVAKLLLTVREAARALSVSPRTLWAITAPRGPIRSVRLRGRVLYSPEELRLWITKQQEASP